MATLTHKQSVLEKYFSPSVRQRLINDDLSAGRNVAAILISVIGGVSLAGILAVVAIVFG